MTFRQTLNISNHFRVGINDIDAAFKAVPLVGSRFTSLSAWESDTGELIYVTTFKQPYLTSWPKLMLKEPKKFQAINPLLRVMLECSEHQELQLQGVRTIKRSWEFIMWLPSELSK